MTERVVRRAEEEATKVTENEVHAEADDAKEA